MQNKENNNTNHLAKRQKTSESESATSLIITSAKPAAKSSSKPTAIFDNNDTRFAFVNWKQANKNEKPKFDVVPMTDVEKLVEYDPTVYVRVLFRNSASSELKKKFPAKVIAIGSKEEMEAKERAMSSYEEDINKEIIKITLPTKQVHKINASHREENQLELLQHQVNDLTSKLKEKEQQEKAWKKQQADYEKQIEIQNEKTPGLDASTISNLMAVSKCVFNKFGTKADLLDLTVRDDDQEHSTKQVILDESNPYILIRSDSKASLVSRSGQTEVYEEAKWKQKLKTKKPSYGPFKSPHFDTKRVLIYKYSNTAIYRDLVGIMLQNSGDWDKDEELFGNNNAETLKTEFTAIYNAMHNFMLQIRPAIDESEEISTLRNLCGEARQRGWKKNPQRSYQYDGKTYFNSKQEKDKKSLTSTALDDVSNSSASVSNQQQDKYLDQAIKNVDSGILLQQQQQERNENFSKKNDKTYEIPPNQLALDSFSESLLLSFNNKSINLDDINVDAIDNFAGDDETTQDGM